MGIPGIVFVTEQVLCRVPSSGRYRESAAPSRSPVLTGTPSKVEGRCKLSKLSKLTVPLGWAYQNPKAVPLDRPSPFAGSSIAALKFAHCFS